MTKATLSRLPFRSPYQRLIALWVLRALDSASAREAFLKAGAYADDDIATFLGLPPDPAAEAPGAVRLIMDGMLARLERAEGGLTPSMRRNFDQLAITLKLSPIEQRVAENLACPRGWDLALHWDVARLSDRIVVMGKTELFVPLEC